MLKLLRPHQWIKNSFLFAALVFAEKASSAQDVMLAIGGFVAFCFFSSAIYIMNDIADATADLQHPKKKDRPIARGAVGKKTAAVYAAALCILGTVLAIAISWEFLVVGFLYIALQVLYTFGLKKVFIIDALAIAMGFVIRALAGAVAIHVALSSWLIACAFTVSLFFVFTKRLSEQVGTNGNADHRATLRLYRGKLLHALIAITAGASLLLYALYSTSTEGGRHFGTAGLSITLPIVAFAFFRYLFVIYIKKEGDDPAYVLLTDTPLVSTIVLWGVVTLLFIYF